MNKITSLIIAGITLSVIMFTVTSERGLKELLRINEQIELLEDENARLEREISQLKSLITASKENSFFLEQKAREELGLSREDEVVYIFPETTR